MDSRSSLDSCFYQSACFEVEFPASCFALTREQFHYSETTRLLQLLEETSQRSGVSRGQAFEEFLLMSLCALSGGQMEEQYMGTVKKHSEGEQGSRGCDSIAKLFAETINIMEETRKDILGDLFEGAITHGENGQFLTPDSITELIAKLTGSVLEENPDGSRHTACDPCCGSGRMLVAIAKQRPGCELIGIDNDLRCVRITALNLALRNCYGWVVWGNSLNLENKITYRTGFNGRGFVREVSPDLYPASLQRVIEQSAEKEQDADFPKGVDLTLERDRENDGQLELL